MKHDGTPEWAKTYGQDRFGPFAEFDVKGVLQRMRWLPPGSFVMGSPEGEEGRYDDEVQRPVTITATDLWIADTPCTQALWTAVTGKEPSRFPTPDRPVETVSFDDVVRDFLPALEDAVPGLEARLPTEEEWEYACRAGSTTAVYPVEPQVQGAPDPWRIQGTHHAELLDPIGWYGGNSGVGFELDDGEDSSGWSEKQYPHTKAGTHPVKTKVPNAWGFYDTLGNVWEWCASFYEAGQDPRRVMDLEVRLSRVLRGGSWDAYARNCRAASRNWLAPESRWDVLGFRLARGRE